jgi:hypothetical protein
MYFLRRNTAVTNWKELSHIADSLLYVLYNGLLEKKEVLKDACAIVIIE